MTICPNYDKENICDCPFYPFELFFRYVCPPAEQIKEDILERVIETDMERRHGREVNNDKNNTIIR